MFTKAQRLTFVICLGLGLAATVLGQQPTAAGGDDAVERIREEGLNHSQVMQTLGYLTDVIGPRLTGSPNLRRANEWTRDSLTTWGLTNAHLEPWGPFGRGWALQRFSAQILEPQAIPLIGFPKAWSPGFDRPYQGNVVFLDATNETDLDKYKGKLSGSIVLLGQTRELKARYEPLGSRLNETNLLRLANAGDGNTSSVRRPPINNPTGTPGGLAAAARALSNTVSQAASTITRAAGIVATAQMSRRLPFLMQEHVAAVVTPSFIGDGGTYSVAAATVPLPYVPGTNSLALPSRRGPWETNAPAMMPQIALNAEDYNRLVRTLKHGETLKMELDLQVRFYTNDVMAYNTVAEIPGTDLKNEIVMLGAHMDSWHSGTGATDNGAGVAVTMEAVRILLSAKLQPRRTVRIALWTGEEEGLFGSKAYVAAHFGKAVTNRAPATASQEPNEGAKSKSKANSKSGALRTPGSVTIERGPEFERLSAYFNLDNGTGKIRGIYLQGNETARPIFRKWLAPFRDDGAETISLANTFATDHIPFNDIGLPGFQFIQDPIEYDTRTHHTNMDVLDRIQEDDLKQASVIMAAFVYNAAMMDERFPRKVK